MSFGLSGQLPIVLYVAGIIALLLSIFWRPIAGIFYLVPLIPLQTVRYWMNDLPLAKSVIPIMLIGVALGLIRRRQSVLPKSPMRTILLIYCAYTLFSLVFGSFVIHVPFPVPGDARFGVWEDYMDMPALLFLVAAIRPTRKQVQVMILLMCVATLSLDRGFWNEVAGRDYTYYTNDLRDDGGAMGYAGVNGIAAFEAAFSIFLLALAAYEKRWLWKFGYYGLSAFGVGCMMYALSRGAYAAFLVGWLFVGVVKNRVLLVLLLIFAVSWTAFVPVAVQQRVTMTYDEKSGDMDHSSELRLSIWQDAIELFTSVNMVFGLGFDTYAYLHRVGTYESAHNILLAVLVETGILGLFLFLLVVWKLFWTSFRLSRISEDPFLAAIALGTAASVLCSLVASMFGDRWLYFQVNGYMWICAGLVTAEWVHRRQEQVMEETDQKFYPVGFAADLHQA